MALQIIFTIELNLKLNYIYIECVQIEKKTFILTIILTIKNYV